MTPAAGPLVLDFDGASRGNPGPASYGVWSPSGIERSVAIGTTTQARVVHDPRGSHKEADALANRAREVARRG